MGKINITKLPNDNLALEIIYGGDDAPFGGVNSSAPPPYIDPGDLTDASNFLIIDKQLIAVGWSSLNTTLAGWTNQMTFLDIGTYTSREKFYNFALAYQITTNSGGPPPVIDIQYTIWVWLAGTTGAIPITSQCTVRQIGVTIPAVSATATIVVQGVNATVAGSVTATIGGISSGAVVINIGDSPATVASNLVTAINAAAGMPCTAVVDSKFTNQIDLTYTVAGFAGNNTTVIIGVVEGGGGTVPIATLFQSFSGGMDAFISNYGIPIYPTSWVQVGEVLYISGSGTVILQFSQIPGVGVVFGPITQYLGAITLGKYNNQLIAVGIVPGPGQFIQASEMIIAWCAPKNQFGVWNPLYSDGTVTGAGFNELTDISDYLTGIFISPGTALLLRSQGLDYITPLTGGPSPFDFQHISNALKGEGSQDSRWITQYDQIGFFIGNSNIYQFSGSLGTIGDKIKNTIIPAAQVSPLSRDATSGTFVTGSISNVLVFFLVSQTIYTYCPSNNTWMILPVPSIVGLNIKILDYFATSQGFGLYTQNPQNFIPVMAIQDTAGGSPTFWQLKQTIQNVDFNHASASWAVFKQEEIMLGRDIIIDSLLFKVAGSPNQLISFSVKGSDGNFLTGFLQLPAGASPTKLVDYPVYFNNIIGNVLTTKNPQLRIDVAVGNTGINNSLSIAKIAMYGSIDPNQKPT